MRKSRETRQDTTQLTERQQSSDTLLNNLPGMAYRCANDQPWTMVFVSGGCEALTGYSREFHSTNGFGWADLIHADDLDAARVSVNAAISAGEQFNIQYRIINRFGQEKWVRENGWGIYSDDGSVSVLVGYIYEFTP